MQDIDHLLKSVKNMDRQKYYVVENGRTKELSQLVIEEVDPGNLYLYIPDLSTGMVEKKILNLNFAGIDTKAFAIEVIRLWYHEIFLSCTYYAHAISLFLKSNPSKQMNKGIVLYNRLKDIDTIHQNINGAKKVSPAADNVVQFYKGTDFSNRYKIRLGNIIKELNRLSSSNMNYGTADVNGLRKAILELLKSIWIFNENVASNYRAICTHTMAREVYRFHCNTIISKTSNRKKHESEEYLILSEIMKESIAIMQERYEQKHETEENVEKNNNTLDKYLLTDRECVYQLTCPKCSNQLLIKRYNIPVFDDENHFVSYYTQSLLYCQHCQHQLMTEAVYNDIQKRISTKKQHLAPLNITSTIKTRDNQYLFEPIAGFELFFERTSMINDGSSITTLAKSSFLADEGYNLRLNELHRHQILQKAIVKYGPRRVADHLRFLITTREGQKNGATKYAKAIKTWKSDLDYVANCAKNDMQ